MEFIEIQNWSEYQHYSQRNPPWIKLHNKILDNYSYGCLPDASKALLLTLYLLASRTENKIPSDLEWIKSKGMLKTKVDLTPLIKSNFIRVVAESNQNASTMLASCKQNGGTETETETETEKSRNTLSLGSFGNVKLSGEEFQKLKDKFGEEGTTERIEKLSQYVASKGKKYKSHYATILMWASKDGGSDGKQTNDSRSDGPFSRFLREKTGTLED